MITQVGKNLTITGRLDTSGEIHVYGKILGQVAADRLFLAANGYLEGDVFANDVRIAGRFNGRIYSRKVSLDSSAEVAGRIFHNTIAVAKGARIDGRVPWRPSSYFETIEHIREART